MNNEARLAWTETEIKTTQHFCMDYYYFISGFRQAVTECRYPKHIKLPFPEHIKLPFPEHCDSYIKEEYVNGSLVELPGNKRRRSRR